jgi:hypothetical protein
MRGFFHLRVTWFSETMEPLTAKTRSDTIIRATSGNTWTNVAALALVAVAAGLLLLKNYKGDAQLELLNVSYDPTLEVYQ